MNAHNPIMAALLAEEAVSEEFRKALSLADVLADSGSRAIPYFLVDTVEGEEVERQQIAPTTVRLHANRAASYSRLSHEFMFDDAGNIVGAVTIRELSPVER